MSHEAFCLNPLHPGPCRGPRTRAREGVRGLLPGGGRLGTPAKKTAPAAPPGNSGRARVPPAPAQPPRKANQGRARVGGPPAPVPPPRKAPAKKAAKKAAAPAKALPQGPGRGVASVPGQSSPANRAASDAGAVAQILLGGGGNVTPQFVEGLMKRVRAAHQQDQREGRGGPDSNYSRLITEESLAMATVLANQGGGTPAERRQRRNRYANIISESMRSGNPASARTLRRELDANRPARTASATPDGPLWTALATFGLAPLDLGAYGLDELSFVPYARGHSECGLTVFCRNPLHPGPCKGWKKTLAKVAPGALKIIEEERLRKVRERREAREKEKGGDKDKPKPPPRKRTPKPKPEPEPEKPARPVALRPETLALVNGTAESLPRDEAGWSAMVRDPARTVRNIDQAIERAEQELDNPKLKRAYEAALKRARAKQRKINFLGPRAKLTPEMEAQAVNDVRWNGTKDAIEYADNAQRAESLRDTRDKIDAMKARGEELTGLNAMWDREDRVPGRTHYERDANGVRLPPPALREAEQRVRAAGAALREDIDAAVQSDPEHKRLQERRMELADEIVKLGYSQAVMSQRRRLSDEIQKIRKQQAERRKALVLDALDQIRPIGGASTTNVQRGDPTALNLSGARPARADWEERMSVVDQHFPNEWIEQANRSRLNVISSDRAFYYQGSASAWENEPDGTRRAGTMAMNTDRGSIRSYNGGFRDDVDEVSVHEMGHRMEAQIAGIKALEYAFIRQRTTDSNGNVEKRQKLSKLTGNSAYRDAEVAYKDDFSEPYTGKTYERGENADDPAADFWEVFQVGLQQTYGGTRFDNSSLTDFTLGVLATVGRADIQ